MKTKIKYSIIIPSWNGVAYLPACVNTIIQQNYSDYELIISDDHSSDGTKDYLKTLNNANTLIVEPPESLSMTEHWEWALTQAKGEWIIFVGQDDGLQPYFFQLADLLVNEAIAHNFRAITSERAYFFWRGCKDIYGDVAIAYSARQGYEIRNSKAEMWKCLLGVKRYFELPQMYTNSLFRRDLLEEAKAKLNGNVFVAHPQDADLAAIASSLEQGYIKSKIPLGWIGSSPRSAGMAIASSEKTSNADTQGVNELKKDYEEKVKKSKIPYHRLAGQFSFNDMTMYFWQALLQTSSLRSAKENALFLSVWLRALILSNSFLAVITDSRNRKTRIGMLKEIVSVNKIPTALILSLVPISATIQCCYMLFSKASKIFNRLSLLVGKTKSIRLVTRWSDSNYFDLKSASEMVSKQIASSGWLASARPRE
jgi:glycosyltransferase involved in cell wall biosynthesis